MMPAPHTKQHRREGKIYTWLLWTEWVVSCESHRHIVHTVPANICEIYKVIMKVLCNSEIQAKLNQLCVCVCVRYDTTTEASQPAAPAKVLCVTRDISVLDWMHRRRHRRHVISSSSSSATSSSCHMITPVNLCRCIVCTVDCRHTVMGRCFAEDFILRKKDLNGCRCLLHFIEHKLQSDNLILRMNGESVTVANGEGRTAMAKALHILIRM